jgi:uncharacterized membrane protein (TIGR02234 family)
VVGYLGISLWVLPDVAVRGADLAHIPVMTLVGSERHHWGAAIAVAAAACSVIAAVLLMRSASILGSDRSRVAKYAAPATRRSIALREGADGVILEEQETPKMSERMIWDALDEGHDPTERPSGRGTEWDSEGR